MTTIQEQLDVIRQESDAEDDRRILANRQEEARLAKLDAAKAKCAEECGEVIAALATVTNPRERDALIELENRTHASHAADLEAAYLEFSGQREGDSNPADTGVTEIDAHVVVSSDSATS
jgi:hypothetical protein